MKYCSECKKLHNGADTICADCNKKYKEIKDINEPVLLCVAGGVERSMLCGALNDANIPFVEKQYGKVGVSNEIVTGYDAKLLNIAFEVPYSAVPKAYEVLNSVGLESKISDDVLQQVKADVESYKQKATDTQDEQMSPAKRTTVKVLSAIAFVVVAALLIWGTDYVMELIKNLFGG